MNLVTFVLVTGIVGLAGIVIGYFLRWLVTLGQKGSLELSVKQALLEAKDKAQQVVAEAEAEADKLLKEAKAKETEKEQQLKKLEDRLIKKDELLDKRQTDIDKESELLKRQNEQIKIKEEKVEQLSEEKSRELERVAKLTAEEAKEELIRTIERQENEDLSIRLHKLETVGQAELERKAKDILANIIQRLATSTVPEIMSTTVDIPSDDLKGKIIGKEGRNIRAFEKATGVEVIIDDTPGSIVLSSFDPVRRQIARVALETLIQDGRIQPAKIEETVDKAKEEISKIIKDKGEAAAYEAGVFNLDPRILLILGRLHFRTSYGQNVLNHSMEVATIARMLAEELGLDADVAKKAGLTHDIGKAVDHEIEGDHMELGIKILQKYKVDERVIMAMRSHHEDYPIAIPEAHVVNAADAISGARPGARRDALEEYLKRLGDLERIANEFPGVEKSYAIQSGRELRVFVTPGQLDDYSSAQLARNIATRIGQELKFPGEIRVVVIRETRAIEYAK